jgi:hypothetical protein
MTHYIGTIYFLGKYRPLSVEGDSLDEVMVELTRRAQEAPEEVRERVKTLWLNSDPRYGGQSNEHGSYGARWVQEDEPAFPHDTWDSMPPCPNLIYN